MIDSIISEPRIGTNKLLNLNAINIKLKTDSKESIFLITLFFLLGRGLFSVSLGANNKKDKNEIIPTTIIKLLLIVIFNNK